jgi:hypothetical protein
MIHSLWFRSGLVYRLADAYICGTVLVRVTWQDIKIRRRKLSDGKDSCNIQSLLHNGATIYINNMSIGRELDCSSWVPRTQSYKPRIINIIACEIFVSSLDNHIERWKPYENGHFLNHQYYSGYTLL